MMVASSAAKPRMVFITSLVSRSFRLDLLAVMFTTTPRAPDRLTPSRKGKATACSAAMRARSTPEAAAEPIIAIPCSAITVRTSWKSTLISPGTLMISEMPATAFFSTLSAAENASSIDTSSPSTSSSFSLRITMTESTCCDSSSIPVSAACILRTPSNEKGLVTTATVRIPISLDLRNNGCRARAGATAHSGGDEGHVRAAQGIGYLIASLQRRGAPGFGFGPCAEPGRPELDLALCLGARQRLSVGVGGDELDAGDAVSDHVIDGIAARAADTDHLDHGAARCVFDDFKHADLLPG